MRLIISILLFVISTVSLYSKNYSSPVNQPKPKLGRAAIIAHKLASRTDNPANLDQYAKDVGLRCVTYDNQQGRCVAYQEDVSIGSSARGDIRVPYVYNVNYGNKSAAAYLVPDAPVHQVNFMFAPKIRAESRNCGSRNCVVDYENKQSARLRNY